MNITPPYWYLGGLLYYCKGLQMPIRYIIILLDRCTEEAVRTSIILYKRVCNGSAIRIFHLFQLLEYLRIERLRFEGWPWALQNYLIRGNDQVLYCKVQAVPIVAKIYRILNSQVQSYRQLMLFTHRLLWCTGGA